MGQIKAVQKTSQQKVISAKFISSNVQDTHKVIVRVRVIVINPARTVTL
ncbi:hypothetical protein AB4Z22_16030 [Paenibacillus sp. TAF58]